MVSSKNLCLMIAAGFVVLAACVSPVAYAQDVYVIYNSKDKAAKNALVKALPSDFKVKTYNVNLLALADYSGKQKVLAKLERARLIVIFRDKPMRVLKGTKLKRDLVVVESVADSVTSETWRLYVVAAGRSSKQGKVTARSTYGFGPRCIQNYGRFF